MLSPSLFRFLRSDPTSTVDRFASRRRSRAIATAALPRRCRRCCAGRPGCPSPSPCDVEPVLHGRRAGPGLAGEPIDERRETRTCAETTRPWTLRQALPSALPAATRVCRAKGAGGPAWRTYAPGPAPGDRPAGQIEVADEHPHDPIEVQALEDFQRVGQVIEITSLVALQQRTQLGRQHLLSRERGNGRLAGKPGIRASSGEILDDGAGATALPLRFGMTIHVDNVSTPDTLEPDTQGESSALCK